MDIKYEVNNKYTLRNSFLINFLMTKDYMKFIIALRPDYNSSLIDVGINRKKCYLIATLTVKNYKLLDYLMMSLDQEEFPKIVGMKIEDNVYTLIYRNHSYTYSFLKFESSSVEWEKNDMVKYRSFDDIKIKDYYTLIDRRYSGEYIVDLGMVNRNE